MPNSETNNNELTKTTILKDNILFIVKIIFPISILILLIPQFLNPETVDKVKNDFKIILLTEAFCDMSPKDCEDSIKFSMASSSQLVMSYFEGFGLIYIRPHRIEGIENWLINNVFNNSYFRSLIKLVLKVMGEPKFKSDEVFERRYIDSTRVILAIFNSTLFNSIRAMFISQLYAFLMIGLAALLGGSWVVAISILWRGLQGDSVVY